MRDWEVRWEGVFIGLARAADAAEAIRIMQARYPHINGGTWTAVELP
jgi:hypothetical protein